MIALIPARAGSKRCVRKAMRRLHDQPLIAYTIAAAQESGVFSAVEVCTDDKEVVSVAQWLDAVVWRRPPVSDVQCDIEWVKEALADTACGSFAILRPTSPFRTAATIRRAYEQFQALPERADSIRAVEPVKQHPGKMWVVGPSGQTWPLLDGEIDGVPFHSRPTQTLPPVYAQNASLEMAKRRVLNYFQPSIAGNVIYPFFTEGYEGFDINSEEDFTRAELLAREHPDLLPRVEAHVR